MVLISCHCRQLSQITFLAQQLLLPQQLPSSAAVLLIIQEAAPQTSIELHYNEYSKLSGSEGRVRLMSSGAVPGEDQVMTDQVCDCLSTCSKA
jgi:hypothetical protein